MEQSVQPGDVVRYAETTTRWFLGVARRVLKTRVELEYLNGHREEVDGARVTRFVDYLRTRDRVLSLKRDDLCVVFYFETFDRLRQDRVNAMQGFLRKHGLRFSPEDWGPGVRIKIWPDNSVVAATTAGPDAALEGLLPKWLEPHRLPSGSRDPLGFQSHAERIANEFLPGLTVFTTRIGYYGFISWACRELNAHQYPAGTVRKELFHRLERALVLCEFIHHGTDDSDCRILGQRSKSEVLQSAVNGRFRVPQKIMKNQESAGAFRLYATSLESNGFAEAASELGADGLLPLRPTELGAGLAREFGKHVPDGFIEFALNGRTEDRETLRLWGKQLCFSDWGGVNKYRRPFLDGFLLGNSRSAEARYKTVDLLFKRKLLGDDAKPDSSSAEAMAEDDVAAAGDAPDVEGISNASVLLAFYEETPSSQIACLQKAAVFELLSLAQIAIFGQAIHALEGAGRCNLNDLCAAAVASRKFGRLWQRPFAQAGAKAPPARELVSALFEAETAADRAAVGGALMARVVSDGVFAERAPDLVGTPVMALREAVPPHKSLAETYSSLMELMVIRHEQVSLNKNRQRWCYLDGEDLVRDDLRPLSIGWHAMRFPQLHALCQDLRLKPEDLANGK